MIRCLSTLLDIRDTRELLGSRADQLALNLSDRSYVQQGLAQQTAPGLWQLMRAANGLSA
ncbi:MAG TPA: hypothetical protein VNZ06_05075 [Steroidobacteraceae bacterium]|jgi:hypothetical protein|nr:hypothetical protein [Steroidobacteraceae bacterium]